jgi:hypothetical protein
MEETEEMMEFEEWFDKIKSRLIEFGWPLSTVEDFDPADWIEAFEDGMSVDDAVSEELRA